MNSFGLNISTFHSFCSKVLHEFPIEANIAPEFNIIDELQAKRLQEGSFECMLHSPSGISRENICRLLGDTDESHVKGYLRESYKNRIFCRGFFKAMDGDYEAIIERWKSQFCDLQKEILSVFQSNKELLAISSRIEKICISLQERKRMVQ